MYLKKVTIRNYGSLKDVSFDGAPFLIFIGPNGAGKSLIFEALHKFFSEFSLTGGHSPAPDLLWYRRNKDLPIEFEVSIEASDVEIKELMHLDDKYAEILKQAPPEYGRIEIKRVLFPSGVWLTKEVLWAGSALVKEDAVVTDGILSILIPRLYPDIQSYYKMYSFQEKLSPDVTKTDTLIVDLKSKKAYGPDRVFDELTGIGLISQSGAKIDENREQWIRKNGYAFSQSPPEEAGKISRFISDLRPRNGESLSGLKTMFKFLPASRDMKATSGSRESLLDGDTLRRMTDLSFDEDTNAEQKWERYRNIVRETLDLQLDHSKTELKIKENGLGLPPSHIGGGEQSVLGLIWETLDANGIIGIEEPENHLHPKLQRRVLEHFVRLSERMQVVVSTHSPIFVSRSDIRGVYAVSKDSEGRTNLAQLTDQNVYTLIDELGVRASDAFDFDVIVFVEGQTDVHVLDGLKRSLLRNPQTRIGFVEAQGWTNMVYYANARIVKSMRPPRPVFIIFDGDTDKKQRNKEIKDRVMKDLDIPEENIITLKKNCIEAYLLVPEAIKKAYPRIRYSTEQIARIIEDHEGTQNKKKVLSEILAGGNAGSYDLEKARRITESIPPDKIDGNIKEAFEQIEGAQIRIGSYNKPIRTSDKEEPPLPNDSKTRK
ncbi:MAG: AAA family ATPase [Promethearchaeati archaeon SRVP18_Atabeyarchaeia-1]